MMYLTEEAVDKIPLDLKQTFQNEFTLQIGKHEIIKMRNNDVITDRDMKIIKFLFNFKFATISQIYELLGENQEKPTIKNRLDKLVSYRLLNKFALSESKMDSIPEDALQIYCLDLGSKYLLANYSNEDMTDWFTTVNMKSSEVIFKSIVAVNIYVQMKRAMGENLISFKVDPVYGMNKQNVSPSFEMILKIGGLYKYFIGEVVRDFDYPIYFREKTMKFQEFLSTNAWKKHFPDAETPPVFLLFAESDALAVDVAKMIADMTEIQAFRLSTDERIKRPLHELGAFLKYVPEKKGLQEVKATTFKGE